MSRIKIENLGPVKSADIYLNKINVFMGPQASGKSTILKTISNCRWLEKNICTTRNISYYKSGNRFYNLLKTFHRFDDCYFNSKTTINYQGDHLNFNFDFKTKSKLEINWVSKVRSRNYSNTKITYIPAERNIVGAVETLQKYKERLDNILNFVYEKFEFSVNYPPNSPLMIEALDIGYYYNRQAKERDIITLNNQTKLPLTKSSSGFISSVPLFVFVDFLTDALFKSNVVQSPLEREAFIRMMWEQINSLSNEKVHKNSLTSKEWVDILGNLYTLSYQFSQFFIEEPEQNLFPQTQRDLVYYLIDRMQFDGRNHKLFLTTHSPYILYALNNCMLGYLVKEKIKKISGTSISRKFKRIDPKLVSIWEIEKGKIISIQGNDGLIEKNYFDQLMKSVMDEYYDFLQYYEEQ